MQINEILTREQQCIAPDATLTQAAKMMKSLGVDMLPVCENDRLIGTITDHDIVVRALAAGAKPDNTTVHQAMTREAVYCFEDEDVMEAALLMKHRQTRRLPVINRDQQLVGVVTFDDLTRTGPSRKNGRRSLTEHLQAGLMI